MTNHQEGDVMLGGRRDEGYTALLIQKLQTLEDKLDRITQESRADLDKLRKDLSSTFVPRDSYEPRHASLIERDAQIESSIRELRREFEERGTIHIANAEKTHREFELTLRRHSDKMEAITKQVEERFKQQQEGHLSTIDRKWLRLSQALGVVATVLAIAALILQHIHFQ